MLKFLSRVKVEFNALDPRTASCMEFLAQCNSRKAKESNPGCELEVKRGNVELPPQITVTFVNGVEEVFDATSTPVHRITKMILEKGQFLETEQMFREAGEQWPVIIPDEELSQHAPGTKEEKVDSSLEFLILASDGLWDVVSNEEAVAMIKPIEDAEEAAKRLMKEAYQRGSSDNITCVVVRFILNNQGSSSRNSSG